jgi:hypothetical protein
VLRRLLLSALAATLVYANVAVIFSYRPRPRTGFWAEAHLPVPWPLADAVYLFGVFSGWRRDVTDLIVLGQPAGAPASDDWETLDLSRWLPQRPGKKNTLLWASRHRFSLGAEAQRRAWAHLAARLRERYNRDHPGAPVGRIAIAQETWPANPSGLGAERTPAQTKRRILHVLP